MCIKILYIYMNIKKLNKHLKLKLKLKCVSVRITYIITGDINFIYKIGMYPYSCIMLIILGQTT